MLGAPGLQSPKAIGLTEKMIETSFRDNKLNHLMPVATRFLSVLDAFEVAL
jgi:hypothetical protein